MSDLYCRVCGLLKLPTFEHTCPPLWSCYEPLNQESTDAVLVYAATAEEAGECFAKQQCEQESECYELYAHPTDVLVKRWDQPKSDWIHVIVQFENVPQFNAYRP